MGVEAGIPLTHHLMIPLYKEIPKILLQPPDIMALMSLSDLNLWPLVLDRAKCMDVTQWHVCAVWGMVQHLSVHGG
jgi:hypothetical protein